MSDLCKRLKFFYTFTRKRLVHLNLQLLYQCNFRCTICDFWKADYQDRPQLSAADVGILADKLRRIGPMIVSIGGGEPLLHPELPEIIRILARDHFPVMICNGWYITPERAKELFSAGLYEISISLDFATAAEHDRLRGTPGAFEQACAALVMLKENRVSPEQRVHMISVVMEENLDQIEALILLAKKLGVTYLVTLYSHGRGARDSRAAGRPDFSAKLLELKRKYPEFVALRGYLARFTEASSTSGVLPCYAGKNLFNIDCQGNVTRCIDRIDDPVGNILSDDPLTLVNALRHKQQTEVCGDCWTSCRGNFETLMYGSGRIMNLVDGYRMLKGVPLAAP